MKKPPKTAILRYFLSSTLLRLPPAVLPRCRTAALRSITALLLFCSSALLLSPTLASEDDSALIKKLREGTVSVITYDRAGDPLAEGKGLIVSSDGEIVTLLSLVRGADRAEVRTGDGKTHAVRGVSNIDREGCLVRLATVATFKPETILSLSLKPEIGQVILAAEGKNPKGSILSIPLSSGYMLIDIPTPKALNGVPVADSSGKVVGMAAFSEEEKVGTAIPAGRIAKLTAGKLVPLSAWETAQELYSTGELFLGKKAYGKALLYFEEALRRDPRHADSYQKIGESKSQMGYFHEAMDAYNEALRINPHHEPSLLGLGILHEKLGRLHRAVRYLQQAISVKPDDAEPHFRLGLIYIRIEHYKDAAEELKRTTALQPERAEAYYQLAAALGGEGLYHQAVEAFQKAMQLDPAFVKEHLLSDSAGYMNMTTVEAMGLAMGIRPDDAGGFQKLGQAFASIGLYREALEAFKIVLEIRPNDAEAYRGLGETYLALRIYPEAVNTYRQLIGLKPKDGQSHSRLGEAYLGMGDTEKATESFAQALRLDFKIPEAHLGLGNLQLSAGRFSEAEENLKKALAFRPGYAEAYGALGVLYGKTERFDEAIAAFKELARLKPDSSEAQNNLGLAYGKSGHASESIEAFKTAIRLKPENAELYVNLGVVYANGDHYPEAVDAFKQALRLKPGYGEARYDLARVYLMKGERSLAKKEYNLLKESDKELAEKLAPLLER